MFFLSPLLLPSPLLPLSLFLTTGVEGTRKSKIKDVSRTYDKLKYTYPHHNSQQNSFKLTRQCKKYGMVKCQTDRLKDPGLMKYIAN